MRTFILRARKGTTRSDRVKSLVGTNEHIEVIAHAIMNAFFVSNGFRSDVEMYIVLDSSEDFPRTIKLSSNEGLSIAGFHEDAILSLIEKALKDSQGLKKDGTQSIAPGLQISGFGFEKLVSRLLVEPVSARQVGEGSERRTGVYIPVHEDPSTEPTNKLPVEIGLCKKSSQLIDTRPVYLLAPKGDNLRTHHVATNPVFILSDHLALPSNIIKSLTRRGLHTISLGKQMLFASQCVTLIHHELDYADT